MAVARKVAGIILAVSAMVCVMGVMDFSIGTGSCTVMQLKIGRSTQQCALLLLLLCSTPSPQVVAGMSAAAATNQTVTLCVAHSPFAGSSAQRQQQEQELAATAGGVNMRDAEVNGSTSYNQYDSRACFQVHRRGMALVVTYLDLIPFAMVMNFFVMVFLGLNLKPAAPAAHHPRRPPIIRASFTSESDAAPQSYQLGLRLSSCAGSCAAAADSGDMDAESPCDVVLVLNP